MIAYLQGRLSEKYPTHVVIECQGVGYEVHVSLHTYSQLGDQEQIKLLTHLHIKEDSHTLYGFCDDFERAIFRLLLSVSGIGTNTARTMLSSVSPSELKDAVIREDVRLIQSIKGIGAKTAQRIILDSWPGPGHDWPRLARACRSGTGTGSECSKDPFGSRSTPL